MKIMSFSEFTAWCKRNDNGYSPTIRDYVSFVNDALEEDINSKVSCRESENPQFSLRERDSD